MPGGADYFVAWSEARNEEAHITYPQLNRVIIFRWAASYDNLKVVEGSDAGTYRAGDAYGNTLDYQSVINGIRSVYDLDGAIKVQISHNTCVVQESHVFDPDRVYEVSLVQQ